MKTKSAKGKLDHSDLEQVGKMIETVRQVEFTDYLKSFLLERIEFRNFVYVVFEEGKQPLAIHHWSPYEPQDFFHKRYLSVAYHLDPYFIASTEGTDAGTYVLSDIAPDRFFQSEYYRTYYVRVNMIDELGYLIPIDENKTIHLSLGRRTENKRYSKRLIKVMRNLEPVLFPLLVQHSTWRLQHESRPNLPEAQSFIDYLLHLDDPVLKDNPLTFREAEVVRLTLQGHSSNSIGLVLDISPWTVKVHRRKIYNKLRISSQLELFRRFLPLIYS